VLDGRSMLLTTGMLKTSPSRALEIVSTPTDAEALVFLRPRARLVVVSTACRCGHGAVVEGPSMLLATRAWKIKNRRHEAVLALVGPQAVADGGGGW
jgi:hypothetical protein